MWCLVLYPFQKKSGKTLGYGLAVCCVLGLFISAYLLKYTKTYGAISLVTPWTFLHPSFKFSFYLDYYSVLLIGLVFFISLLVSVFSVQYLKTEPRLPQYFAYLSLFIWSMLMLLSNSNLAFIYLFWELVGFCSYLLIGFWYQKSEANAAAIKAFLMNRVGDAAFLIGIFLLYISQKTIDYNQLTGVILPTGVGLCFVIGAMAKSAQFPLHNWLPTAMEGPTPVSALIHAATMVAAGIYLLFRLHDSLSATTLQIIGIIGLITMLMAAIKAIRQIDIKKVLAYSTVSQLGLMFCAIALSNRELAFNHLLTHAFFKAGLFLCAGAVIHYIHKANHSIDAQNINLMGGLRQKLPLVHIAFVGCAASMVGLPFFSGFISKDEILATAYGESGLLFWGILIGVVGTAAYSFRLYYLIFLGKYKGHSTDYEHIKENNLIFTITVLVLAFCALYPVTYLVSSAGLHFSEIGLVSTLVGVLGMGTAWFFKDKLRFSTAYQSVFDYLYVQVITNAILKFSNLVKYLDEKIFDGTTKLITHFTLLFSSIVDWADRQIIDGLQRAMVTFTTLLTKVFKNLQTGQLQWYFASTFIFLIVIFYLISCS